MKTVGVLSLQGSFAEHLQKIEAIGGVRPKEVKTAEDLAQIDSLIIPGGESTTIGKLLKIFEMDKVIMQRAEQGMPIWGTCAGMILIAKEIAGEAPHLPLMDISVRRNAYGSQLDSFKASMRIRQVSEEEIPLVFIRAPWAEKAGAGVEVLAEHEQKIIAARQGSLLATAFHPELTDNTMFYEYFITF